jgi:hypothetical protein
LILNNHHNINIVCLIFVKLRFPKPQVLHVALLVSLESSWWVKACIDLVWDYLELQCASYWLLNHFFNWKLNRIETESCIGVCGCSWCCWKARSKSDLIEFIFTNFRAKVWKILILEWFFFWKFKQIAKFGFERKNKLNPQCVHMIKIWKKIIIILWL